VWRRSLADVTDVPARPPAVIVIGNVVDVLPVDVLPVDALPIGTR
jgi:hypothetical protein